MPDQLLRLPLMHLRTDRRLVSILALTVVVAVAMAGIAHFSSAPRSDDIPLPFSQSVTLQGALTDIGIYGGKRIVQVAFDQNEEYEDLTEGAMHIVLTPDSSTISHGARLCDALTPGKKYYGYKYMSRNAATEKARRIDASNGGPSSYPILFPGTFFASTEMRNADDFITNFEIEKNQDLDPGETPLSFADACDVTLEKNARYVLLTGDADVRLTARGLPAGASQCSDGLDNDSDGLTDFPSDPDCESAEDNDEINHSLIRILYPPEGATIDRKRANVPVGQQDVSFLGVAYTLQTPAGRRVTRLDVTLDDGEPISTVDISGIIMPRGSLSQSGSHTVSLTATYDDGSTASDTTSFEIIESHPSFPVSKDVSIRFPYYTFPPIPEIAAVYAPYFYPYYMRGGSSVDFSYQLGTTATPRESVVIRSFPTPPGQHGRCTNGTDDDGDGFVDSDDGDCFLEVSVRKGGSLLESFTHALDPLFTNGAPGSIVSLRDPGVYDVTFHIKDATEPHTTDRQTIVLVAADCDDGIDNNGNSLIDADDPGCTSFFDNEEMPQFTVTAPEIVRMNSFKAHVNIVRNGASTSGIRVRVTAGGVTKDIALPVVGPGLDQRSLDIAFSIDPADTNAITVPFGPQVITLEMVVSGRPVAGTAVALDIDVRGIMENACLDGVDNDSDGDADVLGRKEVARYPYPAAMVLSGGTVSFVDTTADIALGNRSWWVGETTPTTQAVLHTALSLYRLSTGDLIAEKQGADVNVRALRMDETGEHLFALRVVSSPATGDRYTELLKLNRSLEIVASVPVPAGKSFSLNEPLWKENGAVLIIGVEGVWNGSDAELLVIDTDAMTVRAAFPLQGNTPRLFDVADDSGIVAAASRGAEAVPYNPETRAPAQYENGRVLVIDTAAGVLRSSFTAQGSSPKVLRVTENDVVYLGHRPYDVDPLMYPNHLVVSRARATGIETALELPTNDSYPQAMPVPGTQRVIISSYKRAEEPTTMNMGQPSLTLIEMSPLQVLGAKDTTAVWNAPIGIQNRLSIEGDIMLVVGLAGPVTRLDVSQLANADTVEPFGESIGEHFVFTDGIVHKSFPNMISNIRHTDANTVFTREGNEIIERRITADSACSDPEDSDEEM